MLQRFLDAEWHFMPPRKIVAALVASAFLIGCGSVDTAKQQTSTAARAPAPTQAAKPVAREQPKEAPQSAPRDEPTPQPAASRKTEPLRYAKNYYSRLTGLPSLRDTKKLQESHGFVCLKTPYTKQADDVRIRDDGRMEVKIEGKWYEVHAEHAQYQGVDLVLADIAGGIILGYDRMTTAPFFDRLDHLCLIQLFEGWHGRTQEGLQIGDPLEKFRRLYPTAKEVVAGARAPGTYGLPIRVGDAGQSHLFADFDDHGILRVLRVDLVVVEQGEDDYPGDCGQVWKGEFDTYADFVRVFRRDAGQELSLAKLGARLKEAEQGEPGRDAPRSDQRVASLLPWHLEAMSYIAKQLRQYPGMKAFLFPANPDNPLDVKERLVVWNQAARTIYPPPKYHMYNLPHGVVSMELNHDGEAVTDEMMKKAGIAEGYRDDIFYELNWKDLRFIADRDFIERVARSRSAASHEGGTRDSDQPRP